MNRCMRVALNQQKNGLLARVCRWMKSIAASDVSSSIVSMRFLLSGPESSMVCLPTRPQRSSVVGSSRSVALQRSTPRGRLNLKNSASSLRGEAGLSGSRCVRDRSVGWDGGVAAYANRRHRRIFDGKDLLLLAHRGGRDRARHFWRLQ